MGHIFAFGGVLGITQARRLTAALSALKIGLGADKLHLDHRPPLRVRKYNPRIKDVAARYSPNANDPAHLFYMTDADHRLKTNTRGDGAQFPDRVLIKRERRREKPRPKRKYRWASRPLQSRNSFSKPPAGSDTKRQTRKTRWRTGSQIQRKQSPGHSTFR